MIKSVTKKERVPKHIELFHKKLEKKKNQRLFRNFYSLSWIIIILILIILFLPTEFNLETSCDYKTINNIQPENCRTFLKDVENNVIVKHPSNPILDEGNEIQITLFGYYGDLKTKEIEEKILEFKKLNKNKISYSFVSLENNTITKIGYCLYYSNPEKFWPYHNIAMDYDIMNEGVLEDVLTRLQINKTELNSCLGGKLPNEEWIKTKELILNSKISIVPTIFVNDEVFVGNFKLNDYFKK